MKMNIAIVGSSGYIAGHILDKLKEDVCVGKITKIGRSGNIDEHLDLTKPEMFSYEVLNDIDYVIFSAAVSSPDKCAAEYNRSWMINVSGTSYFIDEALKRGCRVIFFSSDAVYGDIPGNIYTEDSDTHPKTAYGNMKKVVEDRFKDNPLFKAIRLSYVVSKEDKFVSYCLEHVNSGETAEIFHPFYRNCIGITDVTNTVSWFLSNWSKYPHSVLNLAGKELVSRIRIADELNRVYDGRLHYKIVRPEREFFKNRPCITQMQSNRLNRYGIIEDNTFTEKLVRELLR